MTERRHPVSGADRLQVRRALLGDARAHGRLPRPPLDDLLTFHLAFGRSVPDVAERDRQPGLCRWPVRRAALPGRHADRQLQGDRPERELERQGRHRLRAHARDQGGWPRDPRVRALGDGRQARSGKPGAGAGAAELPGHVAAARLTVPPGLRPRHFDRVLAGSMYRYDSYEVGERIDHVDGMTIDEAEHRLATRLYQNPARVHFSAHAARAGRFGRCLVYGGHVLSVARALSFNGLGNVLHIAAINGGAHANPVFAGDTVYAWSEVLDKAELAGHPDLGALRLRLVATKDRPCHDFRTGMAKAGTCPTWCSTSITGASCCAEPRRRQRSQRSSCPGVPTT